MIHTFRKYFTILLLVLGCFISETVSAQYDIPEKPKLETSVYDYINLLTPSQKSSLENKLIRYADSTSTQIVCIIIGSTKGEDITMLGAKWGQKWGIGQKGEDNGIVITLAKDDRKVDINTGYGIEYRITDMNSKRIIERIMIPEFKNDNYYAGLDKGSDAIFAALQGEFTEDRDFSKKDSGHIPIFIIIIFVIILISLFRKGGGGKGGGRRGSLLDILILSSMGRTGGFGGGGFGSGGGFGGGGGGFGGGFGGGGFGGGGASGGW